MSDDRDFDPRFDPAFQRGYEGVVQTPAPTPAAAPKPIVTPPHAPRVEPEPFAPLAREAAPRDFEEFTEVDVDAPRSRNPFLIALAVTAVVVTGAGLLLFSRLGAMFADTQSSAGFDYVTFQVLLFATPLIVCLGLATGIGVLFLLAVRWGRR